MKCTFYLYEGAAKVWHVIYPSGLKKFEKAVFSHMICLEYREDHEGVARHTVALKTTILDPRNLSRFDSGFKFSRLIKTQQHFVNFSLRTFHG